METVPHDLSLTTHRANIGLGVLSIPFVFKAVGMAPGIVLLFVLNIIVMCE